MGTKMTSKMTHGQSEAELLTPSASDCALFKIDKILSSTPRLTSAGNIVHERALSMSSSNPSTG
ncbi:MAG: hypothetical protein QOF42_1140 [Gammaproteobacteria bacterium]|jgi:hypothetical protein|nr:hypothetical protein [Gammaproteobacteria bacterium]